MFHVRSWLVPVFACIGMLLIAEAVLAAPTARQRSTAGTLKRKAKMAEELYDQGKFEEAAKIVREVQPPYDELLQEAREEKGILGLLEPVYAQLLRTHALLELEGIALPELKKPVAEDPPGDGTVSFTKQVAAILVSKCGRCHVENSRGMFSMATYTQLMKGSEAGVVIFAKDASGSRLIEVIESGDMPRGGLKVTPDELGTLQAWIAEGAKFDGDDPARRITEFAGDVRPAEAPRLEVVRATGKESISFVNDIAPVIAANCAGCHGNGDQPAARFDLATFENLLRGGDSGPPLVPDQPAESLLIKKLKGTAGGERMPRGQPPLADDVIGKFEKWIEEGATFDARDSRQNLVDMLALAKALRATHEELSQDRETRARQNWRLVLPGTMPDTATTENFHLVGNVGPATLSEYGEVAERVAGKLATLFKAPAKQPRFRGRMTLFVLAGRFDYSEFGKMIEQRQLPQEWRGHWAFTTVDAYGVIVPTRNEDDSNEALLAQVIGATYIASLGEVPRWFAEGAGRAAAARLAAADPRIVAWDAQVASALASMNQPDDFLTGKLSPENADIASYRFVNYLMERDARRFSTLLRAVREGQTLAEAFLQVYRATPAQVAESWLPTELPKVRRP